MTPVVFDASVAVKWFVREADSDLARGLIGRPIEIHAPTLLRFEVISGLSKQWRKKLIAADQVEDGAAALERMIAFWHDDPELAANACKLSLALDHPVYDCVYIALARRLAAPLVTADRRLLDRAPEIAISPRGWSSKAGV